MPKIGRLRYLEAPPRGKGRVRGTLVLIHAFPLSAAMWEPQFVLAESGWRIIAPQLRGMDGVAGDPLAGSMDDYAGDVIDLLDALRIDEAVFAGLSMGGYVVFALCQLAPRYVGGMVLSDTRPGPDSAEGLEGRKHMLTVVKEQGMPGVAADVLPKLLTEETRRLQPEVESRVRELILRCSVSGVEGAIRAMMTRADATPLLSRIHCPTLVVVGGNDALTPPAASRDIVRGIDKAELAIVSRAGHLPNLEQPEAFNAVVGRFLEHRV